jgi:KUP system potassium uptake protein
MQSQIADLPGADRSAGTTSAADAHVPARPKPESHGVERSSTAMLALGALGVVFGDIGTSPLYAIQISLKAAAPAGDLISSVFGVLSLVFWAVTIVVSIKYVLFIMRAENKGEGGILALMAMALQGQANNVRRRNIILGLAMIGAALFYGDAIITPAISVLSAVEGLEVMAPSLDSIVVPLALIILIGLFVIQSRGTKTIGMLSGPVMVVYFTVIAVTGLVQIFQNPAILTAVNPIHGLGFVIEHPMIGFLTLGSVFLAVTGAEAVYADMGHFGRRPIRLAWFGFVFPALVINYFGQGALVLSDPKTVENPFYNMVPHALVGPLIILATLATIIASQAVITGAFSLTRQAIQLGLVPRMQVTHTSASERGQIYMPAVNWALLVFVALVVVSFRSSTALANAYGISVTGTMLATTTIFFFVARNVWKWPAWQAAFVTGCFFIVDATFLSANLLKFAQGGWLPVSVGFCIALLILTWRQGRDIILAIRRESAMPLDLFLKNIQTSSIQRVSGTAVYMTADTDGVPHALLHNMKHNQVLHEHVVFLTVTVEETPRVPDDKRVEVIPLSKRFWRVILRYGFMENVDVPQGLALAEAEGLPIEPMRTSFFLGRETLVPSVHPRMMIWRENLFIMMMRLAQSAPDFFNIPADRVIEVGTKVEI